VEGSEAVERKVEWTARAALQVGHRAIVVEDCVAEDPWEEMTVAAWTVKECQAEGWLAMEPVEALTEEVAAEEPWVEQLR
jgi:nicotinamidase-related amidase